MSNKDRDMLQKVKKLSNGKFGKPIVVSGDAQIVIQRLMEIHILVSNYLAGVEGYSEVSIVTQDELANIKLPKYNSKKSRLYFSPNTNPQKAHRNGFNLAVREIKHKLTHPKES